MLTSLPSSFHFQKLDNLIRIPQNFILCKFTGGYSEEHVHLRTGVQKSPYFENSVSSFVVLYITCD